MDAHICIKTCTTIAVFNSSLTLTLFPSGMQGLWAVKIACKWKFIVVMDTVMNCTNDGRFIIF